MKCKQELKLMQSWMEDIMFGRKLLSGSGSVKTFPKSICIYGTMINVFLFSAGVSPLTVRGNVVRFSHRKRFKMKGCLVCLQKKKRDW